MFLLASAAFAVICCNIQDSPPTTHLEPRLDICRFLPSLFLFISEYESNLRAVSGFHHIDFWTNFEKLIVASVVSPVFLATAILRVSAVALSIAIAILALLCTIVSAVIAVATAVPLIVAAFAVTKVSIFCVALLSVATGGLFVLLSWCSSSPSPLSRCRPDSIFAIFSLPSRVS